MLQVIKSDFEFSPPYGDGTCTPHCINFVNEFSPPYGDGTYAEPYEEVRTVFAPLRGWYRITMKANWNEYGFRPLTGMVH